MKKIATCVALISGVILSGVALAVGGSYVSTAAGATIYAPNYWYTTNFPIVGSVLPNAELTTISWSYSVGTIPSGGTFQAYLCHGSTSACLDVTSWRSGSTSAFAGRDAATAFFLYYRINRSSSFAPVAGGSDQVIVNWTVN
jgi:flagellar protein FlhE